MSYSTTYNAPKCTGPVVEKDVKHSI